MHSDLHPNLHTNIVDAFTGILPAETEYLATILSHSPKDLKAHPASADFVLGLYTARAEHTARTRPAHSSSAQRLRVEGGTKNSHGHQELIRDHHTHRTL